MKRLSFMNEAGIIAGLRKRGLSVIENYDPAPFKAVVGGAVRKSYVAKNGPELLSAIDTVK